MYLVVLVISPTSNLLGPKWPAIPEYLEPMNANGQKLTGDKLDIPFCSSWRARLKSPNHLQSITTLRTPQAACTAPHCAPTYLIQVVEF